MEKSYKFLTFFLTIVVIVLVAYTLYLSKYIESSYRYQLNTTNQIKFLYGDRLKLWNFVGQK